MYRGELLFLLCSIVSCEFLNLSIKEYFEYYTSSVDISRFELPSGTIARHHEGYTHISTEKDAIIKIQLINPQSYPDLEGTIKFHNEDALKEIPGFNNIKFEQDINDKSIFNLTLSKEFLAKAEESDTTNDISCTIEVHNAHKQSNEFKLNLKANAPPKPVENLTIMQVDSIITLPNTTQKRFVVCFDMPINDATKKDVNKIRISTQQNSTNPPVDPVAAEFSILPTYTSNADLNFEYITNSGDGPSYISSECFPNLETATTNCGKENSDFTNTSFSLYYPTQINAEIASDYTFTVALEDTMGLTSSVEVNLVTGKLATPTLKTTSSITVPQEEDLCGYIDIDKIINTTGLEEGTQIKYNHEMQFASPSVTFNNCTVKDNKIKVYPGCNILNLYSSKEGKLDSDTTNKVYAYLESNTVYVANTSQETQLGTKEYPFAKVSQAADALARGRYSSTAPTATICIDNRKGDVTIVEEKSIIIESNDISKVILEPLNKESSNKVTIKKAAVEGNFHDSSLIVVRHNFDMNNITLIGTKNDENYWNCRGINLEWRNQHKFKANISDCYIKDFKVNSTGAGIYIDSNESLTIDNSTIINCEGVYGGAIDAEDSESLILTKTNILNNKATFTYAWGGGIVCNNIYAENCIIAGNVATATTYNANGGGIYFTGSQEKTLKNCTIGKCIVDGITYGPNKAIAETTGKESHGGGIYIGQTSASTTNIFTFNNCIIGDATKNTTFTDNTQIASTDSSLPSSENAGNIADYGAAIYVGFGFTVNLINNTKVCYNYANKNMIIELYDEDEVTNVLNIGAEEDSSAEIFANYSAGNTDNNGTILTASGDATINIYGKVHHNYSNGKVVVFVKDNANINMLSGSEIKYNNMAETNGACIFVGEDSYTGSEEPSCNFKMQDATILCNYTKDEGNQNYEVSVRRYGNLTINGKSKVGANYDNAIPEETEYNCIYLSTWQDGEEYKLKSIKVENTNNSDGKKMARLKIEDDHGAGEKIIDGDANTNWSNHFTIVNSTFRFGNGSGSESYCNVYSK